ncbi:MAG: General stress protein 69 [Planctomycetes bacterium ADurb.Bin126]|nr:MAG: General stress protein 69 [Planctomycetes bacterium ADurb.Bin126]HOD82119.1 aldo/keto reductase [Phycisphaerae bacterium]HQL72303.1 aldo/keto reductase [Phycisphaerae bacterium]
MTRPIRRRTCLAGLAGVTVLASDRRLWAAPAPPPIPQRVLGKTLAKVSILGLGGAHAARVKDDGQAVDLIRRAVDMGITFLDNAWLYAEGRAEQLMGRALQGGYGEKVFLMTKTTGRDKASALKQLDDSLRRLKVDVIDLWQAHQVTEKDEPGQILAKGGAIEAFDHARKAGKVRFIGFTGHRHPELHMQLLASDYPWDTVQMPVNVLDPHFRSFARTVLPKAQAKAMGIIAMKTLAYGNIVKKNVVPVREALSYVWSQPVDVLVSGIETIEQLQANVQAAREFKWMEQDEQQKLLARTREAGHDGKLETFKAPQW